MIKRKETEWTEVHKGEMTVAECDYCHDEVVIGSIDDPKGDPAFHNWFVLRHPIRIEFGSCSEDPFEKMFCSLLHLQHWTNDLYRPG